MVCFWTTLLRSHPAHARHHTDPRVPAYPEATSTFAAYVRTLTWFMDTPAPAAPFSVHRTALAGKEHGQRLGASTSTGAIQALVGVFPVTGLGVGVARDGTLYPSNVFSASFGLAGRTCARAWGERGVVVLVGLRLTSTGT
jgi:cysteine protease ATG4